ncbi:hypothetical protein LAH08_02075 [Micromonospora noduli]|uniref:Uncharacterized protein n=1 Tax=Micromonospora noduli TaxID=709876 RepID=A0A328N5T5_9ACTN|nr:hypothetical protein LAH08_02075 [Micromonospora noduli]
MVPRLGKTNTSRHAPTHPPTTLTFTIFAGDHLWSGVDSVSVTPAAVNLTTG